MPGYNHYSDCSCGWCAGGGGGLVQADSSSSQDGQIPAWQASHRSFVDPNASCPVCGAAVFYYQSPDGGRVFFDEMGPPWPKHPCTDNSAPLQPRRFVENTGRQPTWIAAGWRPLYLRTNRAPAGGWWVIKGDDQATLMTIELLLEVETDLQLGSAVMHKRWDSDGCALISYLDVNGNPATHRAWNSRSFRWERAEDVVGIDRWLAQGDHRPFGELFAPQPTAKPLIPEDT